MIMQMVEFVVYEVDIRCRLTFGDLRYLIHQVRMSEFHSDMLPQGQVNKGHNRVQ